MLTSPKIREVPVHHEITETLACTVQDLPSKLGRVYGELENWARRHHVRVTAPFARYTLFTPAGCTVQAGYILDRPIPADDAHITIHDDGGYVALTATHVGPYSNLSKAYEALQEFMHIHGYASAGAPVEYYLTPPDVTPEQQKAEIVWPVVPNEM